MKRVLLSIVSVTLLAVPAIVLAQPEGWGTDVPRWDIDIWKTLDLISDYVFWGLIVLATIFIIIAGYNFVTAAGDPERTKTARNFVLYALIGVLVGFLARALINFVGGVLVR